RRIWSSSDRSTASVSSDSGMAVPRGDLSGIAPPIDSSPRAYSYARYSTQQQSAESGGESLRRQLSLARAWCASQNPPIVLDEELADEAVSGSKGKHITSGAALGGFLDRVRRGEIRRGSYLIFENFSRLSRLPVDLSNRIISDLIQADIQI